MRKAICVGFAYRDWTFRGPQCLGRLALPVGMGIMENTEVQPWILFCIRFLSVRSAHGLNQAMP